MNGLAPRRRKTRSRKGAAAVNPPVEGRLRPRIFIPLAACVAVGVESIVKATELPPLRGAGFVL